MASIRQVSGLRTTERLGTTESGTNTERTGYESSPLAYGQGTTTAQHDSSRLGEEGQKQHHGHGIGFGHHKSHQEGKFQVALLHIRNSQFIFVILQVLIRVKTPVNVFLP